MAYSITLLGASAAIVKLPATLGVASCKGYTRQTLTKAPPVPQDLRSNMIALRHTIELMYGETAMKPESWDGHA